MTIDENLDWLYRLRSEIYVYMPKEWLIPMNNSLDMAIKALKQYGALQEIQKEICDMYPNYTDEKGYRMIRKSDVLNIIDKHIKEIEDIGDYPDTVHNQFDNMTGSMNL